MDRERRRKIRKLLNNPIFNITPKSEEAFFIYDQALTHRSFAKEMKDRNIECFDNERLEFFGNFILGMVVSEYLFKKFDYSEGEMTKRMQVVSDAKLAEVIIRKNIGLNKEIIQLGKGRKIINQKLEISIIACAVEAFIAAIYLDQGMDKTKKVILALLGDEVDNFDLSTNYIGRLQELVQRERLGKLKYLEKRLTGPDHKPTFRALVKIGGRTYGQGTGKNKRAAKMKAAKAALKKLE